MVCPNPTNLKLHVSSYAHTLMISVCIAARSVFYMIHTIAHIIITLIRKDTLKAPNGITTTCLSILVGTNHNKIITHLLGI